MELKRVYDNLYNYFDKEKNMLFILKKGVCNIGIIGQGDAWHLSLVFSGVQINLDTFVINDSVNKIYKEEYSDILLSEADVFKKANMIINNF